MTKPNGKKAIDLIFVKVEAIQRHLTLKQVADGTGYKSYNHFIQILNGFKPTPKDFVEKMKEYFRGLDELA